MAQLQALDVPARMEEIRGRLTTMNESLGAIDFSIVVDPVIAEIEAMRDTLAKIDVSSMSEITVGALKVSVTVITDIDFSTAITDFLMAKFDEILKIPTDLATQVEVEVNVPWPGWPIRP